MLHRVPIPSCGVLAPLCLAVGCAGGTAAGEAPDRNRADLPISTAPGERVLEFDFPGLRIGIAEYPDGPTGVTVLRFAEAARVAMDVRGGSPGVVGDYGFAHAIVLAGGSLYGLEAVSGVASRLLAERRYVARWDVIPLVSGGVIYDFDGRDNSIYPDKRLGRAASGRTVPGRFPLGARGAGISATVGKGYDFTRAVPAGQGAAFREVGRVKILAATVLNAVGSIFNRQGEAVRGDAFPAAATHPGGAEHAAERIAGRVAPLPAQGYAGRNTTLTVVVTNLTLERHDLIQTSRQLHTSMANAIRPFHTRNDGDTLWLASTSEVNTTLLSPTAFGVAAAEVLWDAVLSARP